MRAGFILVVLAGVLTNASATDSPAEEYRVKGAFLLNFTKFVEWPATAWKAPGDPISICVLGGSPFTPALDQAAKELVVANRQVAVSPVVDLQMAHKCQIVFVPVSERKRARALIDAVKGESVLTVGESEGFIASGGIVEFRVEDSKVRMEINAESAKRAGLHVSAKLLSLSQKR